MVVNERPKIKKNRALLEGDLQKMSESKNLNEEVKMHMKHKPYKCDFGGGKNDTDK